MSELRITGVEKYEVVGDKLIALGKDLKPLILTEDDDLFSKTFILTDSCMWEANKQKGTRSEHCVEVVDLETGQTRYIASGSHIRFVDGKITEVSTQEMYNAQPPQL